MYMHVCMNEACHVPCQKVPPLVSQRFNSTGKTVFKKPVKLTLTVMPTQTTPSAGELSEASIVFDGKTFTVTFTQTAGECEPLDLC